MRIFHHTIYFRNFELSLILKAKTKKAAAQLLEMTQYELTKYLGTGTADTGEKPWLPEGVVLAKPGMGGEVRTAFEYMVDRYAPLETWKKAITAYRKEVPTRRDTEERGEDNFALMWSVRKHFWGDEMAMMWSAPFHPRGTVYKWAVTYKQQEIGKGTITGTEYYATVLTDHLAKCAVENFFGMRNPKAEILTIHEV